MSETVKGSEIKLNDIVKITIKKSSQTVETTVQGQVTGIRFWRVDQIAIEFDGIDAEWFYLDNNTEVEVL